MGRPIATKQDIELFNWTWGVIGMIDINRIYFTYRCSLEPSVFLLDVITNPCSNKKTQFNHTAVDVMGLTDNYMSLFSINAITEPCPNPDVGSANL